MDIRYDNIPDGLRDHDTWIVWRLERRDGDETKVPYNPTSGDHASTTDPTSWTGFDTAREAVEHRDFDGLGFVFTSTPYMGVDLDHIRDPETGELTDRAAWIVERLDSYTEVSPSGDGLHVLVEGEIPGSRSRTGDVEMYDTARFFTVTGAHVDETPATVNRRPDGLAEVYERVFGESEGSGEVVDFESVDADELEGPGNDLDDDEIVSAARSSKVGDRFARLWNGDNSAYPSQSEADLALCSMLAFWTSGDGAQIDRMFRDSGLYRPKWDEARGDLTYGQRTIVKALSGRDEQDYYTPGGDGSGPEVETPEIDGPAGLLATLYGWADPVAPSPFDGDTPALGVRRATRWLRERGICPALARREGVKAADSEDYQHIRRIDSHDLEDAGLVKPGKTHLQPWWSEAGPFLIFPYRDADGEVATFTFRRCFEADAIDWWDHAVDPPARLPLREGLENAITQPQWPFGWPEQVELAAGGGRPLYVTATELEALAVQSECRRAIAAPPTSKGQPVDWQPKWCEGWDRLPGVVVVSEDLDLIKSIVLAACQRLGRAFTQRRVTPAPITDGSILGMLNAGTLADQIRDIEASATLAEVTLEGEVADDPEAVEERAAIMEYHGGLDRDEAERLAGECPTSLCEHADAFREADPISDADLFGANPQSTSQEVARPAAGTETGERGRVRV